MKGGTCQGNNVQGLHVRVLDNNIWKRKPTGGRDSSYEGTKGTPEGNGPPVTGPGGTSGGGGGGAGNQSAAVPVYSQASASYGSAASAPKSTASSVPSPSSTGLKSSTAIAEPSLSLSLEQNAVVNNGDGLRSSTGGSGGFTIDLTSPNTANATSSYPSPSPNSSSYRPPSSTFSSSQSASGAGADVHPSASAGSMQPSASGSQSKVCKRPKSSGSAGGGDVQPGVDGTCEFGKWQCGANKLQLCGNLRLEEVGTLMQSPRLTETAVMEICAEADDRLDRHPKLWSHVRDHSIRKRHM